MSWLTVAWSMAAAICATLAIGHCAIWLGRRFQMGHLFFGVAAFGAAGEALAELIMLKSTSVDAYAAALRVSFVTTGVMVIAMVWYVRAYFDTGRRAFALAATAGWALVVVIDALSPASPIFETITRLSVASTFWGEPFALAEGVASWLRHTVTLADLLVVSFVVDAAVMLWQRGRRRLAWIGGLGLAVAIVVTAVQARMVDSGQLAMPYIVTVVYVGIILAAGHPISSDVLRVTEINNRLLQSEAGLLESRNAAIRALEVARQAEERFRSVVEAAPSAMIMVDAAGRIVLVNALAESAFGYARAELIGMPIEALVPERSRRQHNPDRDAYVARPTARQMGAGRELFGRRKDGSEVPVEVGLNPIHTVDGMFVLASVIDISERRRAELEFDQQRNELAHLSRVATLGELAASLAHELNQPLTAIVANAQSSHSFLGDTAADRNELRMILEEIAEAGIHAGEVIRRLRLLLRKGEVKFERVEVADVVQDTLKLAHGDLVLRGVAVTAELAHGLPPIAGDRVQLLQVLLNLVVNGCDAMERVPGGSRKLLVRADANGSSVRLSIVDRGIGIPPARLEEIFEPFVTTKDHGMGLGLAVCRTIVTAHRGTIWASNNTDGGATVHVSLPSAV
jgi:PAS domain S-box-containing protein